jgi:NADPH:quinone reductase-like Zn-dependent oxidoreductase
MRAYALLSFDETPAFQNLPIPVAKTGYLVRVNYAGVNPIDFKLLDRLTAESSFPVVVGLDFAGVLEQVPEGQSDFKVGDRVFGTTWKHGSYAEYTAPEIGAQGESMAHIPDGVSDEDAAALPVAAAAALGSLNLLETSKGQTLVIMGATGGVGGYAVQMAKARGAHVIATVRGDANEAGRLGADEVFDTNIEDVLKAIRDAHPEGVDAVMDLISGKDTIGSDVEILKPGGSVVSTIFAADEKWFSEHQIKAQNLVGLNNPSASSEGLKEIMALLAEGKISTRIRATVGLDEAKSILEKLRNGGLRGKAVIKI